MKLKIESLRNRAQSYICEIIKKIRITHKLDYGRYAIYLNDNIRLSSCKKEPDTIKWIETFTKEDVVFDIGANVGAYSLIAAKFAKKVYAFEPSSFTFNTLLKNIHSNHAFNIVLLNIAIAQSKGMYNFAYSSITPGDSGHSLSKETKKENCCQELLSYSIDEFISDFKITPPNHIKIDVDGIELEILKGARNTLQANSFKSLLVEMNTAERIQISDYFKQLGLQEKAKYDLGQKNLFNYLFVKEDKK